MDIIQEISKLLPTKLSSWLLASSPALATALYNLPKYLPLKPLELSELDMFLIQLMLLLCTLLCLAILSLISIVKSHNQLSAQLKLAEQEAANNLKKAEFNYAVHHSISG
jgi:hypothetical protein